MATSITLAQVETAINSILTLGQSYRIDGREYTFADLEQLRAMRNEILAGEAQKAGENQGGLLLRVGFRRPA